MICPHCNIAFHDAFKVIDLGYCGYEDIQYPHHWVTRKQECPSCHNAIVRLGCYIELSNKNDGLVTVIEEFNVFPKHGSTRPQAPITVPLAISNDYNEAAQVLDISAQASAALSRRCLQHLLADTGLSTNSNLDRAITEAKGKNLPSHIAEHLDAVRAIGNFAAHTQKSVNTGEILPVEPHEAEWNLEVLDMLFDFCYVQPAKNAARRASLDAKLAEAGKPLLK